MKAMRWAKINGSNLPFFRPHLPIITIPWRTLANGKRCGQSPRIGLNVVNPTPSPFGNAISGQNMPVNIKE
jgi:hypothetical protein